MIASIARRFPNLQLRGLVFMVLVVLAVAAIGALLENVDQPFSPTVSATVGNKTCSLNNSIWPARADGTCPIEDRK